LKLVIVLPHEEFTYMKITKAKLKKLIKEETQNALLELGILSSFQAQTQEGACREEVVAKLVKELDARLEKAKTLEPARYQKWRQIAIGSLKETPEKWADMVNSGFYSSNDRQIEHKKMMWVLLQKHFGVTAGEDPCAARKKS